MDVLPKATQQRCGRGGLLLKLD